MMASSINPTDFREVILNVSSPIVIKNLKLPWKCFDMSLTEWCSILEDQMLAKESGIKFEIARKKHFDLPQWEKFRNEKFMNIIEFAEAKSEIFEENWACLSYRNILELPTNLRKDITFSYFGFSNINDDDITFWLNTKDSNTPCHYDTYGCNIVVQVFGSKSWLLFPTDSLLNPIRIPYEESSIYCSENFYSPQNLQQFAAIKDKCYRCVLKEGDVLVVPKNWWHYVESLETSLSFNYWIPLESDLESQLDECIVKYLIERFVATENESTIVNFLNPNQISTLAEESEILCILDKLCRTTLEKKNDIKDSLSTNVYSYMYLKKEEVENLIKKLQCNIQYVDKISENEFLSLMGTNSVRFNESIQKNHELEMKKENKLKEILMNSICNPVVISSIKKLLLENYKTIK